MTGISDIVARLEAGETGPEIDASVFRAVGYSVAIHHRRYRRHTERAPWERIPAVSTSLDAIERLMAEVLPGWMWVVCWIGPNEEGSPRAVAALFSPGNPHTEIEGRAPTVTGAWLAAILRAYREINHE